MRHSQRLKRFRARGWENRHWQRKKIPDLMISEYLVDRDTLEGAGLQDVLLFAIKREQQAVEFYSKMTGATSDAAAKRLCEKLVHEELKHKMRLETFYDDLFYGED